MALRCTLPALAAVVVAVMVSMASAADQAVPPEPGMVQRHLLDAVDRAAKTHREQWVAIATPDDIAARQQKLRDANKPEFTAALDRVLAVAKDPVTRERAERYLQGKTWERR